MRVYRIVKMKTRTRDLSGTGAFRTGGRWNSEGTYMLYTSANSSLALLETLVHFELADAPPQLYIMEIEVDDKAPIYTLPDKEYPTDWLSLELRANKVIGDRLMADKKYLGIRVRSAVNTHDYNYLLNPLYPGYHDLVKVASVEPVLFDHRLVKGAQ